jgi:glycine cleavage system H protein
MKFTETHEWVDVHEGIGTVGVSSFVQNELGEIVHVELPSVGTVVRAGDVVCILESTKSATDIYSPVSGRIVAINTALQVSTEAINQSPESSGWLYQIELSSPDELDSL